MSEVIGRWPYTVRASDAEEMIRDRSGDAKLVVAAGQIRRIPGGPGWKIWEDAGGYTCLSEFTAAECDELAARAALTDEQRRAEEERLREQSRAARELGPASARAPR